MKGTRLVRICAAAAVTVGLTAFGGAAAWAAPGAPSAAVHLDPTFINPAITGPPPAQVVVPGNCPAFLSTDSWSLDFTGGGNAVSYGTVNKNGDWGGVNAEGPASFATSDGTVQYSGQLHVWFGGGQNYSSAPPTNQSEQGFTLAFNGSGIAGNLTINAHMHTTTNNNGVVKNQILGASVTCS